MKRVTRRSVVRRRTASKASKPEMKIWTGHYPEIAIYASQYAAPSTTLYAAAFIVGDAIKNITIGTGSSNRIGTRIFVKKIQYSIIPFLCPEGNNAQLNSGLIRFIVSSAGWEKTAGTTVAGFSDSTTTRPINFSPNRRFYSFFKDTYLTLNSGYPASVDGTGNSRPGLGMIKHINLNINVNKEVKFSPDTTSLADESSSYSLFAIGAIPAQPGSSETRVACANIRLRIWYTDV